jgi:hypothetical protein
MLDATDLKRIREIIQEELEKITPKESDKKSGKKEVK